MSITGVQHSLDFGLITHCCKTLGMDGKRLETDDYSNNSLTIEKKSTRIEKKSTRTERLEKKKVIEELIKAAYAEKDHLSPFQTFCHFCRNGLSLHLEYGRGNKLASPVKQYIQKLLKLNMEGPFGFEWPMEEKVKRREMVSSDACYIFVREISNVRANGISLTSHAEKSSTSLAESSPLIAFVHFRFSTEEEIPVLYVYELQIEPHFQGRGLGKYLMQLLELIGRKNYMEAVMLTVQKVNSRALYFYTNSLRYTISSISPSRVDPNIGNNRSYEILCKPFSSQAKAFLVDL